jgi:hypothetical protein
LLLKMSLKEQVFWTFLLILMQIWLPAFHALSLRKEFDVNNELLVFLWTSSRCTRGFVNCLDLETMLCCTQLVVWFKNQRELWILTAKVSSVMYELTFFSRPSEAYFVHYIPKELY